MLLNPRTHTQAPYDETFPHTRNRLTLLLNPRTHTQRPHDETFPRFQVARNWEACVVRWLTAVFISVVIGTLFLRLPVSFRVGTAGWASQGHAGWVPQGGSRRGLGGQAQGVANKPVVPKDMVRQCH